MGPVNNQVCPQAVGVLWAQGGIDTAQNNPGLWRVGAYVGNDFLDTRIPVGHDGLDEGHIEWFLLSQKSLQQ